jgi:hypothetical protein
MLLCHADASGVVVSLVCGAVVSTTFETCAKLQNAHVLLQENAVQYYVFSLLWKKEGNHS